MSFIVPLRDKCFESFDASAKHRIRRAEARDLANAMHDGGVVTAFELAADHGKGCSRHFLGQVHRDLTRSDDRSLSALAQHVLELDIVILCHGSLNFRNGYACIAYLFDDVEPWFLRRW